MCCQASSRVGICKVRQDLFTFPASSSIVTLPLHSRFSFQVSQASHALYHLFEAATIARVTAVQSMQRLYISLCRDLPILSDTKVGSKSCMMKVARLSINQGIVQVDTVTIIQPCIIIQTNSDGLKTNITYFVSVVMDFCRPLVWYYALSPFNVVA